jgi:hypothetical protein
MVVSTVEGAALSVLTIWTVSVIAELTGELKDAPIELVVVAEPELITTCEGYVRSSSIKSERL